MPKTKVSSRSPSLSLGPHACTWFVNASRSHLGQGLEGPIVITMNGSLWLKLPVSTAVSLHLGSLQHQAPRATGRSVREHAAPVQGCHESVACEVNSKEPES